MSSRRTGGLGYPPYRVDILTSTDGVEFDDAWPRLIRNKVAADRPQDRADVARLTQPESPD